MTNISPQAAQAVKKPNGMPTPSAVLAGGSLVQMVYEPEKRRTLFAVFRDGEAHYEDTLLMHGQRLVPYSPHHSLIMHEAEVIKILNNANAKSFPVLRSDVARGREFDPHPYQVYGPKLVATRGSFEDKALESRCLTEEMGQQRLREDIPLNLTDRYKDDARQLRNRVLLFRFRNVGQKPLDPGLADRALEPRLNQVFIPLLSIIADDQARQALTASPGTISASSWRIGALRRRPKSWRFFGS